MSYQEAAMQIHYDNLVRINADAEEQTDKSQYRYERSSEQWSVDQYLEQRCKNTEKNRNKCK